MIDASAETPQWPALATKGFIVRRPATQQDVAKGNAVFSAEKNGKVIGTPLSIQIPQYAFRDDGKGHKIPVIVVQAESANGLDMAGLRNTKGGRPGLLITRVDLARPNSSLEIRCGRIKADELAQNS